MYSEGAGRFDFFIEPIHPDEKSHPPKPLRSAPPSPADTMQSTVVRPLLSAPNDLLIQMSVRGAVKVSVEMSLATT